MSIIDLHTHSTFSDGLFTPAQLIAHALKHGVSILALTDHDETAGLSEAEAAAQSTGLALIPGVEISVSWQEHTIHMLGIRIDRADATLSAGIKSIRESRVERAQAIADELQKIGIVDSFGGAMAYAANENTIGRMHFARFLVKQGHAKDTQEVFKKFLVEGKPGFVPHQWAKLDQAVQWVVNSGGVAVLAHPGRYKLTSIQMKQLLVEFKELGGEGIEVVTPNHSPDQMLTFAHYARTLGLVASCGSDFHGLERDAKCFGKLPPLPAGCQPLEIT